MEKVSIIDSFMVLNYHDDPEQARVIRPAKDCLMSESGGVVTIDHPDDSFSLPRETYLRHVERGYIIPESAN